MEMCAVFDFKGNGCEFQQLWSFIYLWYFCIHEQNLKTSTEEIVKHETTTENVVNWPSPDASSRDL